MVEAQVGIAVCGHVARREWALELSRSLSAPVALDDGSLGSLPNHDRAWSLAADQGHAWSLVLEDDAVLATDFVARATQALEAVPAIGAVSFYLGGGQPRPNTAREAVHRAVRLGASWVRSPSAYWGVALALPTQHVHPMLQHVQRSALPYDTRFGTYLCAYRMPCFYTVPSLVDHRDAPSLITTSKTLPTRTAIAFDTNSKAIYNSKYIHMM